jgi:hypothetical protein
LHSNSVDEPRQSERTWTGEYLHRNQLLQHVDRRLLGGSPLATLIPLRTFFPISTAPEGTSAMDNRCSQRLSLWLGLIILACSSVAAKADGPEAGLLAGVSKVDVTPPIGFAMWG